MFSHLDKIAAGEEEALEPYEQIDPRVMERSADDNENVDSDELPSLFCLNDFGKSYLDLCKTTYSTNIKGTPGNGDEQEHDAPSDSDGSVAVTDDMIIQSLLEAGQDLSLRVLKPSMDVKIQTYRATCVKIVMSLIGTTMREELLRFRHGEPSSVPPCENLLPLQWHAGLARLACSTGSTWFEASVVVKALLSVLSWSSQNDHDDTELPPYADPNDIVVSLEDKSDLEKDLIYEFDCWMPFWS